MIKRIILTLLILFVPLYLYSGSLSILASYTEPSSLEDQMTLYVEGESGDAYLEIIVEGSISDFRYASLSYGDDSFIEGEVIASIPQIKDGKIVILCSLPEGMPFEGLFWTDSQGQEHSWFIQDCWFTGMGSQDPVLLP